MVYNHMHKEKTPGNKGFFNLLEKKKRNVEGIDDWKLKLKIKKYYIFLARKIKKKKEN